MKRALDMDAVAESKKKKPRPSSIHDAVPPSSSCRHVVDGHFKGYDLSELPQEAWPQDSTNKGAHGYTIKAGGAAICLSIRCFLWAGGGKTKYPVDILKCVSFPGGARCLLLAINKWKIFVLVQ